MGFSLTSVNVYSLYDHPGNRDSRYIPKISFKAFSGGRGRFVAAAVAKGIRSDVVVLSHINLLFVASLIKSLSPETRIIVYAHGIEIWRDISNWKRNFLIKHCEIWSVSSFTASVLTDTHQVPPQNISILPNCLDPYLDIPERFAKPENLLARYGLNASQPILFTLSRLSSYELYKGYDAVLEVLPNLIQIYPDLHYLLAGQADKKEHQRLQNMISDLGIAANVTLTGFIPDDELSVHFLLTDVFVLPSKKEGFGIVFIEAAACGCKIIGGNQDGSTQALLEGRLGTLINPGEKETLIAAICENLDKPKNIESSKAIQALCIEHFNYELYLKKVDNLLTSEPAKPISPLLKTEANLKNESNY